MILIIHKINEIKKEQNKNNELIKKKIYPIDPNLVDTLGLKRDADT